MGWLGNFLDERQRKQGLRQWALAIHDRLAAHVLALTSQEGLAIKDDFDLRFEVMTLLVSHQLFLLHQQGEEGKGRMEILWEITFEGFEYSLRERGVNDIRIAHRMQKLFQNATGRRNAYLAMLEKGDTAGLRAAVARNVLNSAPRDDQRVDRLLKELAMKSELD